jgi:spermidine synthase
VAGSEDLGWWVGRLTTVNTLGAVVGSLVTGYLVLPALGSEGSIFAVALMFAVTGLLTTRFIVGRARLWAYGLAGATAAVWLLTPRWDLARLTAGTNVYFDTWAEPDEVLFVRDDIHGGITTVTRKGDVSTLYTNGKFQGNTGWEMNAQRFFAHYPSIFVNEFERALVIGLGTGTTLGTIAAYPWKKLDLVEISPAIVEAAGQYFESVNGGALRDPRLTIHLADGRNFLLVEEHEYDLISMELSSVWFAGAASLYSQEFYRLVERHLAPRGVLQQWVQMHHMRREDFATLVHTLRSVFPHVALFYGGHQGILVASMQPLVASDSRVHALQRTPEVIAKTPENRPLMTLLDDVLLADADLDRFLEASAREAGKPLSELVSTDRNLYLEYATPRGNTLPWSAREALVGKLLEFKTEVSSAGLRGP